MKCVRETCSALGIEMKVQNDQTFSKTYVCPKCGNRCDVNTPASKGGTILGILGGIAGLFTALGEGMSKGDGNDNTSS